MVIDGKAISTKILNDARELNAKLGRELHIRAIVMQPNAATESYLRVKSARAANAGMHMDVVQLPDDAQDEEVVAAILAPGADAVIVQLPLPERMNTQFILDYIPVAQDADVLSSAAYEQFVDEDGLLPPVVGAVREVLEHARVDVEGKRTLVIGAGKLVGQPAAVWLERQGAIVTVITSDDSEEDRLAKLAEADIIVSGAGSPHLILPEQIKDGVVLIDAGTSESNGSLAGDAHPDCSQKASVFTPVPGGLGPIAVACLFKNAAELLARGTAA